MTRDRFAAPIAAWLDENPTGDVITYRDLIRFANEAFDGEAS